MNAIPVVIRGARTGSRDPVKTRRYRLWIPFCSDRMAAQLCSSISLGGVAARRLQQAAGAARLVPRRAAAIHPVSPRAELMRGFFALAFGSDLRIGARPRGIRRFDHPIRVAVIASGSVDRSAAMARVIEEYARQGAEPASQRGARPAAPADIEVRLIDERDFKSALQAAFGAQVTTTFIARTDPQCMTSVEIEPSEGGIVRSVSFIIVDQGRRRVPRLRLSRAAARLRPVEPRPAQSLDHAQPETHGRLPDGL